MGSQDASPRETQMPKQTFIVLSSPVAGREDEYNAWYDRYHMTEVVQFPGFVSAQRFKVDGGNSRRAGHGYVAVYEVDSDDPARSLADMWQKMARGEFTPSDAIDTSSFIALACTPITGAITPAEAAAILAKAT